MEAGTTSIPRAKGCSGHVLQEKGEVGFAPIDGVGFGVIHLRYADQAIGAIADLGMRARGQPRSGSQRTAEILTEDPRRGQALARQTGFQRTFQMDRMLGVEGPQADPGGKVPIRPGRKISGTVLGEIVEVEMLRGLAEGRGDVRVALVIRADTEVGLPGKEYPEEPGSEYGADRGVPLPLPLPR
jgi:hypothetical protein